MKRKTNQTDESLLVAICRALASLAIHDALSTILSVVDYGAAARLVELLGHSGAPLTPLLRLFHSIPTLRALKTLAW